MSIGFAGLYFLYRALVLFARVCSQSWLQFYSATQIQLVLALFVHAIAQPHKERKHNIIDSMILTNLSIIMPSVSITTAGVYYSMNFTAQGQHNR